MRSTFRVLVFLAVAIWLSTSWGAAQTPVPDGMVLVPAGSFIMGTDERDSPSDGHTVRSNDDAQPQHQRDLPAFFMDKTEVTNAQYKKFCDATNDPAPPHWKNGEFPPNEADFAVTHVNWYEATAYANWIGKRLPSEAEWEKAARGTDGRRFPWGDDWEAQRATIGEKVQKVGANPAGASPFGALDMAGNVFEWTADWYQAYSGSTHQLKEFGKQLKVCRGGAFNPTQKDFRTFNRGVAKPQMRSLWIGFRCAKDAP